MRQLFKILFLSLIIVNFNVLNAFPQNKKQQHKLYSESIKYFNNEEYEKAIPYFKQLEEIEPDNFEIRYYLGVCYLNTNQKDKAIPYLEYAVKTNESSIPADIFKDLGLIYHNKGLFEKALNYYKKYQRLAPFNDQNESDIKLLIENSKNAKKIVKDSVDVKIENIGPPVNSPVSENYPMVVADESLLIFSRVSKIQNTNVDSIKQIMISHKEAGKWGIPVPLIFDTIPDKMDFELAGISSDGQYIFINSKSNLYSFRLIKNKCTDFQELPKEINTAYNESAISINSDGSEIFFSSDMPGGLGGKDIYKITKDENGKWGSVVNLGNKINTSLNEDYPFIFPDNKTLYFSSQGHNSIGGFDIFKTTSIDQTNWSKPKNIGYPINSTYDDLSFSIIANGKIAYISRKLSVFGENTDIYKIVYNNSVPLTLVKGTILAGDPLKPIGAKIKVIDKETNIPVKYIYNPNPSTGKFLMIFPPGKNYDMLVEAENYLPQLINIYVPNQTYFYELYQEINLKPITTLGKVVGEEIIVKNTFYDLYSNTEADSVIQEQNKKDYNTLINLIEDIINSTDSLTEEEIDFMSENVSKVSDFKLATPKRNYSNLFNLINKAINATDSVALIMLDKNTIYEDKTKQSYFYAENKKNNLIPYVINNDTIYTTPPLNTTHTEKEEQIQSPDTIAKDTSITTIKVKPMNFLDNISESDMKIILTESVIFPQQKTEIPEKYIYNLNEVAQLITNNKGLFIKIVSCYDKEKELLNETSTASKRVKNISKIFTENNIDPNLCTIREEKNQAKVNTVTVNVFEIIKHNEQKLITDTIKRTPTNTKPSQNQNIVYKVQLKASMKQISLNSSIFKGLSVTRYYHNGMYKYVTGSFSDFRQAKTYLAEIVKMGFDDAFIVAFKNGKRIEVKELLMLIKEN